MERGQKRPFSSTTSVPLPSFWAESEDGGDEGDEGIGDGGDAGDGGLRKTMSAPPPVVVSLTLSEKVGKGIPDITHVELGGCFNENRKDKRKLSYHQGMRHIYVACIDNPENPDPCECSKENKDPFPCLKNPKCKSVIIKFFEKEIKPILFIGSYEAGDDEEDEDDEDDSLSEIKYLNFFQKNPHPNIMGFFGIYKLPDENQFHKIFNQIDVPIAYEDCVAVMERGSGALSSQMISKIKTSLGRKHKLNGQALDIMTTLILGKQIIRGLLHMHSNGVLHLDLKPVNIGIFGTRNPTLKLIDFGNCQEIGTQRGPGGICAGGTIEIVPPESNDIDLKFEETYDYHSYGVVLYYIYKGHYPLDSDGFPWRDKRRMERGLPDHALNASISSRFLDHDYSEEAQKRRREDFGITPDKKIVTEGGSSTLKDLLEDNNEILYNIIEDLLSVDPGKRSGAIEGFQRIQDRLLARRAQKAAMKKKRKTRRKNTRREKTRGKNTNKIRRKKTRKTKKTRRNK